MENFILDISSINTTNLLDKNLLGGKGYSIARLKLLGYNVPDGIIITTFFFETFFRYNNLKRKIENIFSNEEYYKDLSKKLKQIILNSKIPEYLIEELDKYLKIKNFKSYIVRSSATIEDELKYSFAGQFTSVLNVKKSKIYDAILEVYASLFNEKVLEYIKSIDLSTENFFKFVKMAVIIQEFINTDFGGVIFTTHPISNDSNKILIEYVEGLCKYLVSGKREPMSLEINKDNLEILLRIKSRDVRKYIDDNIIKELAKISIRIEKDFGYPCDIEFGIKDNKIFIFQVRPITTLKEKKYQENIEFEKEKYNILRGIPASKGIAKGIVLKVYNKSQLKKLTDENILVCKITYDNYLPDMLKARAIVTELGSLTSHAAIVAREYNIPCVVGVNNVMNILKNGTEVIVDGTNGIIYYKGKKLEQVEIPEEAKDFVLDRLIPYRVSNLDNLEIEISSPGRVIREPQRHILIEEFDNIAILYFPAEIRNSKKIKEYLEKIKKKRVVIGEEDKFDMYVEIMYEIERKKKFKKLLEKLKESVKSSEEINAFANYCLKKDLERLRLAENILNKEDVSLKELSKAINYLNESWAYFELVNTFLTMGYGIDHIRKLYREIQHELNISFLDLLEMIDGNNEGDLEKIKGGKNYKVVENINRIIEIYKTLKHWKFKSNDIDEWFKREELWRKASKTFKQLTGKRLEELTRGWHGSGYNVDRFLKSLIRK